MSMRIHDRRRSPRLDFTCPVKVYDPRSRRYRSGVTRNVSASGALIELHAGMHTGIGDEISLAIDWAGVTPLMTQGDMLPVCVTRLDADGDTQLLAVKFAGTQPLPLAA